MIKTDSFIRDSAIGFDICLVLSTVSVLYMKINLPLKGWFTRLKTK
jgi:hypothetical protein